MKMHSKEPIAMVTGFARFRRTGPMGRAMVGCVCGCGGSVEERGRVSNQARPDARVVNVEEGVVSSCLFVFCLRSRVVVVQKSFRVSVMSSLADEEEKAGANYKKNKLGNKRMKEGIEVKMRKKAKDQKSQRGQKD